MQHLQGAPDLSMVEAHIQTVAGVQTGGQVGKAGAEAGNIIAFLLR